MSDDINIEEESQEPGDKLKKLKEKLKKCQKEKEEYLDGWQRAKADFINSRKEEEKRREELVKFSNFMLISEILPVFDSFDLAFSGKEENEKSSKGFLFIKSQLEDILKKYGLEVIKALGEKFNPELHESVGEVESDKESGIVIEEVQKGYMLNGRVLRAAKVKISK